MYTDYSIQKYDKESSRQLLDESGTKIQLKKKKLFFALENIEMVDQNDLKKINTLWLIKKELPNCYKFEN